jgi:hypothetical protein
MVSFHYVYQASRTLQKLLTNTTNTPHTLHSLSLLSNDAIIETPLILSSSCQAHIYNAYNMSVTIGW